MFQQQELYDLQKDFIIQTGYTFGRKLNGVISKSQDIIQSLKVHVYFSWSNKYQEGKWFENDLEKKSNCEQLVLLKAQSSMEGFFGKQFGLWVECIRNKQHEVFFKGQYENGQRIGKWKYFWKKNLNSPYELIWGGSYVQEDGKWVQLNEGFNEDDILRRLKDFNKTNKEEMKALTSEFSKILDHIQNPPVLEQQQGIWSFSVSIWFKDFQFENEEFLRKCFENDWSYSKISNLVTNQDELNEVKNLIWKDYKMIKETYKWYSSKSPSGEVWSISNNVISDFAFETGLFDKTFKLSDLDLKFIATCAASFETERNHRNPERALCRYQFMEFLVRVSMVKYLEHKLANNIAESVQLLLDQCRPIMQKFDAQKWRDERYFNKQCDYCLKHYKPKLYSVYYKYCVKKVKSGQKKYMNLENLRKIWVKTTKLDDNHEQNSTFNLSIASQIDELESDRIFQMNFVEFMEAIARMADKVSLPVAQDIDKSEEQHQQQPLHIKLERFIIKLAQSCAFKEHKLQFGNNEKSIFVFEHHNN
ncbi:unnamed protein product (macronuclear) [Paramecium tetraurelia]|uniref:Uncharacterized protein n=1 Tax=Paramecium tetraurelia TaxID=5888 RepID=A0D6A8_PARTE|nr:uncharacterized protein GSPATT00039307001 [Paramecium tetraurelia]CAK78575.1 unnamed protein product [Paramecium tetraurelia]|eukprot:XP_001445972.1 hypothetical protein (macronuclear) [Paramecium tetraurelia strain d4-2]